MQGLKPALLMVVVQIAFASVNVLYKLAINDGMSEEQTKADLEGDLYVILLWPIWAKMSKEYPSHHSSTALMSIMGAIQATGFALCIEKDWSQWRLGWSISLLTAAYSGIVASGLMVNVIAWCVNMKGPVYVSVFNPLMLVLVAIAGSLMLDESLYIGSVIGAVLIMVGLYMVLWGKSKETKKVTHLLVSSEIEVVVASMTVDDHDNSSHLVTTTISEDEVHDIKNNRKEDMAFQ
ncbi:hypothetical protein RIF29_41678 [Crotalaria pallida]|uniref:WAT1-related protein n=1 Tax=Crotalaria pallida TaxID=3830 RepID=A0AAN9E5I6_CROPI